MAGPDRALLGCGALTIDNDERPDRKNDRAVRARQERYAGGTI